MWPHFFWHKNAKFFGENNYAFKPYDSFRKLLEKMVLHLKAHWITLISIISLITTDFVMWMNINGIMCKQNRHLFGYMPVSNVRQSDGERNHSAWGML